MTKNRKGGKGQAFCVHLSLLNVNVFPRILPVDFLLFSLAGTHRTPPAPALLPPPHFLFYLP